MGTFVLVCLSLFVIGIITASIRQPNFNPINDPISDYLDKGLIADGSFLVLALAMLLSGLDAITWSWSYFLASFGVLLLVSSRTLFHNKAIHGIGTVLLLLGVMVGNVAQTSVSNQLFSWLGIWSLLPFVWLSSFCFDVSTGIRERVALVLLVGWFFWWY